MPAVDVESVLEEDRRLNRRPNRYGIKIPTTLSEQDGDWYELGNLSIWKIRIYSRDATALNFHFNNLHMPDGSEMYLYSESRNMIAGPMLPKHVRNGVMPTDQIFGEQVTIAVYVPQKYKEDFTITINNVIHAFEKPLDYQRDYGESKECNNNINCPIGNTWQTEKNAVCRILRDTTANHCTGTLINSACQDLTPLILTAEHCVDDEDEDLDGMVFRFHYDSPSSTCHGHQGEPSTWLSFLGADLRASWDSTDFALLELKDDVGGNPNLAMAGWDRKNCYFKGCLIYDFRRRHSYLRYD